MPGDLPRAQPPSDPDRIFLDEHAPTEFRFDEAVAKVLPDMLRRSIPGYSALLHLIGVMAGRVVKEGSIAYDLGCSLGAVSLSIRHAIGSRSARIIAVDNSPAMVERCRAVMDADSGQAPVTVELGDIATLKLEPCSLVVLNFTLQFAPPELRQSILSHIAQQLVPGGVLILSEKTLPEDESLELFFRNVHDSFRQSNGYTQLELSRKREALDQVLRPDSTLRYVEQMSRAGLAPIQWFQTLQFVSWVATKPA